MSSRYEQILHASHDFITLVDRNYTYAFVNESYCQQMGIPREEIVGKTISELWGQDRFDSRIRQHLDECFEGRESHNIDRFRFGKGYRYIHVSYSPYRENGEITHVMIYSHDISALKELEFKILDFEFKDSTTGLFNRKSFDIVLEMELDKARRSDNEKIRAVLFLNLRNFSQINAQYGPQVGDLLLESTAIRVKEALRSSDYVFRYEGKELAVILTSMKRTNDIGLVANHIQEKATFPYHFRDEVIHVGCNIGAAVSPVDGDDKEVLISKALSAMNHASETNLPLVVFNQDLQERAQRKARLRSEIRRALVEEQFSMVFQPIVHSATGALAGAETLIRWDHRELGSISPAEFIPLAEESGDTIMIGRWNLFRLCRLLKKWEPWFSEETYISVNLSVREFTDPELVEYVEKVLVSEGVNPSRLKLEITETQTMSDLECAVEKIRKLESLGLEVMIDDFGSGYSSLAYLKKLPVKTVKIDKIFVDRIVEDQGERDFLAGMIAMIRSRDKEIVVEGVETGDQVEILKDLGVKKIQGFYFGRPILQEQFETLLQSRMPLPREEEEPEIIPPVMELISAARRRTRTGKSRL